MPRPATWRPISTRSDERHPSKPCVSLFRPQIEHLHQERWNLAELEAALTRTKGATFAAALASTAPGSALTGRERVAAEAISESRWRGQSARQATPSTGNPCAARTRCLRPPAALASAAARHPACARTPCSATVCAAEPAAPRAARTHLSPSTTRLAWARYRSGAALPAARTDRLPICG